MDYEKAYKESFEAAKGLHEAGNALTKKQMEIVFPQLAESEDERIRRTLAEYFGPEVQLDFVRGVPIQKIRDWLEKQKEQKPAEWSEEDERILTGIIERGSSQIPFGEPALRGEQMEWLMNRLKSLRNRVGKEFLQPHWKPSEEQMKALLKVVDKARELHYSSNSGYDEYDVLRLLYGQLKKL